MKRTICTIGLITVLILVVGTNSSKAQVRIDLSLQVGTTDRIFNRYYTDLAADYHTPYDAIYEMHYAGIPDRDMPVILYIMVNSKYSLRQIYSLRARGATWAQLSKWCGVPLYFDNYRLFFRHDVPPYGNAYGYYKRGKNKEKNEHKYNGYYNGYSHYHK